MEDRKISHMEQRSRIRSDWNCAARIVLSLTGWGLRYLKPNFFLHSQYVEHMLCGKLPARLRDCLSNKPTPNNPSSVIQPRVT